MSEVGRAAGENASRYRVEEKEKSLHTTHAITTRCERQCMPVTKGDLFEDEVIAHSVCLEDIEEVDRVMNITDAAPGSDAVWKRAG